MSLLETFTFVHHSDRKLTCMIYMRMTISNHFPNYQKRFGAMFHSSDDNVSDDDSDDSGELSAVSLRALKGLSQKSHRATDFPSHRSDYFLCYHWLVRRCHTTHDHNFNIYQNQKRQKRTANRSKFAQSSQPNPIQPIHQHQSFHHFDQFCHQKMLNLKT